MMNFEEKCAYSYDPKWTEENWLDFVRSSIEFYDVTEIFTTLFNLFSVKGFFTTIEFLLNLGVNINSQNQFNQTVLMYACGNSNLELVKYLVEKGANVNMYDNLGKTSLIYCCLCIMDTSSDLDIKNTYNDYDKVNDGETESNKCYETESNKCYETESNKCYETESNKCYESESNKSCESESDKVNDDDISSSIDDYNTSLEILKFLLKSGADPNLSDKEGITPIYVTASNKYTDATKILLDHGAKVNVATNDRETPLMTAANYNGRLESVKLLIEHGADYNFLDVNGFPVIGRPICRGYLDITQYFIQNLKININHRNHSGNTILYHSINISYYNCTKMTEFLLRNGANPDNINNKGKSPRYFLFLTGLKPLFDKYPKVITLRSLCLRIIFENNINIDDQPHLLFKYPDEFEEEEGYNERIEK